MINTMHRICLVLPWITKVSNSSSKMQQMKLYFHTLHIHHDRKILGMVYSVKSLTSYKKALIKLRVLESIFLS